MANALNQPRGKSKALGERASRVMPGGVNSPVRSFRSVGCDPLFVARGAGAHVWDADGREYIDFVGSWGPLIFGHAAEPIVRAIHEAARAGTSFGASTEREVQFAELLTAIVPSLEKLRLVNSGTEACMSALRVARGFTRRDRIVKIDGGYHGHMDALLVRAGSGAETLGVPDSAGVPKGATADTFVVAYNDLPALEELFAQSGPTIAAVIIEPVAGNMGCVPPWPGYLAAIRRLTTQHGALLIFDEVMTGFRLALGGAQALFAVTPDLTCLGKIIGGGLPLGAYGGRADIMAFVAPEGPVYQAGTLSGNPLAVAAGMAAVELLQAEDPYVRLQARGAQLADALRDVGARCGFPLCVNQVGSMLTAFFTDGPVTNLSQAKQSHLDAFAACYRTMLEENQPGIFWPPSQFEAAFISTAHSDGDIDHVVRSFEQGIRIVAARR